MFWKIVGAVITMAACVVLLLAAIWATAALSHTHDWAQLTPQQRQWFQQQRQPGTKAICCSEPDIGHDAETVEDDIRDGHYWVRSPTTNGEWVPVPDDKVLTEPNKFGRAVVWWRWLDGQPSVFCFSPGAGI